ncbi:Surface polysaccharide O-acyltransferase, integral membrane enzyme [Formivibrio citricus]|uniref:Surface polysaccharide O-acyltransferase, integral membrane enzyme n=1 Tax=Formivibrio citricus TaxID=83765 RepID=A0A1I4Y5K2_9NEIS|nr:acyltransferase family protein [Formivibrio citricus]SFN33368.1 Surface polysaccharide O-acyltransferase, integral membrane enzyme [Formivibrio citricus]
MSTSLSSQNHLDWADGTRCIAAFAVVALHVAASAVTDPDLLGTGEWWIANAVDAATRWCVPVFVMLSGALLLAPDVLGDSWGTFYRHRFTRVLMPLAFWSLFYLAYELYWMHARGESLKWGYLIKQTAIGSPYFHLWYLFMLPGLYLLTPLLRRMLAVLDRKHLVFLCAGSLLLAVLNKLFSLGQPYTPPFAGVLFVPYLGYFLAGYLLHTGRQDARWPWPVLLASIALTAAGCGWFAEQDKLQLGTYFYDYFSITTVPMGLAAFALCRRLSSHRLATKLAPLGFGIYLIHPLVLDLLWQANIRPTSQHPALAIPLLTCFTFAVSGLGAWLVSKIPLLRRAV